MKHMKPLNATLGLNAPHLAAGPHGTRNDDNGTNPQVTKLRKASRDFEAIFIRQMFKTMRSTIPGDGMFGKGPAGEIYGGMMDTVIGDVMAERGTLGLADTIFRRFVTRVDASYGTSGDNDVAGVKAGKDNG